MTQKKFMYFLRIIAVTACALLMAGPSLAEEVKIGSGAAAVENIFNKITEPMEKATGVKLAVVASGPVQAIKDLDAGTIDGAVGGVTFPDWMAMMEKEGYPIADKSLYKNRVIGKDLVKVITNKDVTVSALSKEQLAGIFTGKIKNWSEVGGPDLPVVVILGSKIPGTQGVFQKQVLDGQNYSADAQQGTTADDLKTRIIATSGGISLAALAQIDGTVNGPSIPEVGRPITLITKGAPSPGILKMIEFINGEGQQYIVK